MSTTFVRRNRRHGRELQANTAWAMAKCGYVDQVAGDFTRGNWRLIQTGSEKYHDITTSYTDLTATNCDCDRTTFFLQGKSSPICPIFGLRRVIIPITPNLLPLVCHNPTLSFQPYSA